MDNSVSRNRLTQLQQTWEMPDPRLPFETRQQMAGARRLAADKLAGAVAQVARSMKAAPDIPLDLEWRAIARNAHQLPWSQEQAQIAAPVLQFSGNDPEPLSEGEKKAFVRLVEELPPYPHV